MSVFAKLSSNIIVQYCNDLHEDIMVYRDIDYLVLVFCSVHIIYKYCIYSRLQSPSKELLSQCTAMEENARCGLSQKKIQRRGEIFVFVLEGCTYEFCVTFAIVNHLHCHHHGHICLCCHCHHNQYFCGVEMSRCVHCCLMNGLMSMQCYS